MIHEALHVYTKESDKGLASIFELNWIAGAHSSVISNGLQAFFESDCKNRDVLR